MLNNLILTIFLNISYFYILCINLISMKTKILISAANGIIMRSLINELKKKFYVIGIDSNDKGDAKKYCNEFYHSPKGSSDKFVLFLKKISKKVDFVFLYVDEEIRKINNHRKALNNIIKKIIISEKKTIDTCLNKKKFFYFCKENKINYPSENYSKKMLAKPVYGRGSRNIFIIKNKIEYNFFKFNKNFLIQKFINGDEYTIDCLYDINGGLIFALPRLRMVCKGESIVGKIIKDQQLIDFVIEFSKKIKFYGPINIQVIKDKNNKIWIIEVNPRLSGSIEFSIKAGFNPLLLYSKNKKFLFKKIKYNHIFKRSYALY